MKTAAGYISCYQCSPFIGIISNDTIGCICFRSHFHTTIRLINTRNVVQNSRILWLVVNYKRIYRYFLAKCEVVVNLIWCQLIYVYQEEPIPSSNKSPSTSLAFLWAMGGARNLITLTPHKLVMTCVTMATLRKIYKAGQRITSQRYRRRWVPSLKLWSPNIPSKKPVV